MTSTAKEIGAKFFKELLKLKKLSNDDRTIMISVPSDVDAETIKLASDSNILLKLEIEGE